MSVSSQFVIVYSALGLDASCIFIFLLISHLRSGFLLRKARVIERAYPKILLLPLPNSITQLEYGIGLKQLFTNDLVNSSEYVSVN